ncbi:MAG: guanylate kinase [bacterium]|nr:MAG: guanylate kinase [bacterium]
MKGLLVILSSPSGGGKTSVIQKILQKHSEKYVYSISATTRKPRPGEIDGKDYFFLSEEQFRNNISNDLFLEWENVHGYFYGTPKAYIEKCINDGKFVLLDIDVNGALQVAQNYPEKTITIFISPPSMEKLIERLQNRQTDSDEEINKRLERIPIEMEKSKQFDYIVFNYKLDKTAEEVVRIVDKKVNV